MRSNPRVRSIAPSSTEPPQGRMHYTPKGVYIPGMGSPITIALLDDYDVVVMGVAYILEQYRDRVTIAELDTNQELKDTVDIVLYDTFAQAESDHDQISDLVRNPRARHVVVYTWNFHPDLINGARARGVHGYLSKALPARDFVAALEAIHADRPGVRDLGPDYSGQEQCRGGSAHLPQPEHREVLHSDDLPQDRRRQSHAGRALGCPSRLHARSSPH